MINMIIFQIEENLLERQNLIDEQKSRPKGSGWRPTGDALIDTYGDRRETQLEHIAKLKALEAQLQEKLQVSLH